MRVLQVVIPEGKRDSLFRSLEDEGITYFVTEETSGREYSDIVSIILPLEVVEETLDLLATIGIDERSITIISDAETIISEEFEEFEAEVKQESTQATEQIAREELKTKADELLTKVPTYAALTICSAVIATVGLLLDSPATVVGSMVIAPLIGPAMSAAVGTVMDDRELFREGVKYQLLGVFLAILSATVFAVFVRYANLVPPGMDPLSLAEVSERATPSFLILVVARGAGVAGILSLMTGVSTALVGVMIAVALIPPAAAVGVGIAFMIPRLVLGASVLVAVNVLSINLAALLVLWRAGYQPDQWFHSESARKHVVAQVVTLLLVIAVLSAFLGGVTYDSYIAATTEDDIHGALTDELDQIATDVFLVDLEVHRSGILPPQSVDRVAVTVGISPDIDPPPLAERFSDRLDTDLGLDVTIEVHYRTVDRG